MAVDPKIAAFFKDPDASSIVSTKASQIVAPLVRGEDVKPEELAMGGGLRIVHYIIDRSPSMEPVADLLLHDFNEELVAAIKDAREDDISTLRIGGTSFSTNITPIWEGDDGQGNKVYYHSLDKLPKLTKKDYNPKSGWSTALHEAIPDGTARAMKFAVDQRDKTGTDPDIDVVVLSDARNNCPPLDPKPVRDMITGRNKRRVRYVFFFFQTELGEEDPEAYAREELGIDGENVKAFMMTPGESKEERRSRFRAMMRVMSRVSASKGMSAVKAAAAPQTATDMDDEDPV